MRANALVHALAVLAVCAQNLKASWKTVLVEIAVRDVSAAPCLASNELSPKVRSVVVDVIQSQEGLFGLAATCTLVAAIVFEDGILNQRPALRTVLLVLRPMVIELGNVEYVVFFADASLALSLVEVGLATLRCSFIELAQGLLFSADGAGLSQLRCVLRADALFAFSVKFRLGGIPRMIIKGVQGFGHPARRARSHLVLARYYHTSIVGPICSAFKH